MKYEIHKTLVLSTAHVSVDTLRALGDSMNDQGTAKSLVAYSKGDYGWYVQVPEDVTDPDVHIGLIAHHKELMRLCLRAETLGCEWLCLDCDGPEVDGILTFEHS